MTQPETPRAGPVADGPNEASSAARGEIRVKLFARTDVGQIREHNEDNFLVADLTRKSRGLLEANRAAVVGPHGSLFADLTPDQVLEFTYGVQQYRDRP